jgi:CHAT domain-containing protein/Flp pilus assembly protein TadD
MDTRSEQDNLFRWYLLGATSPEEDEQIEQRLRNQEINNELLLAEEELIDDYARGELALYERELFEENFLTTPERLKNLLIAQAAVRYAANQTVTTPGELTDLSTRAVEEGRAERLPDRPRQVAVGRERRPSDWWQELFEHRWKIATYAVLVLVIGIGSWWGPRLLSESEVARGLTALNNAFRAQRPTEARITGLGYAVSNVIRGGQAGNQKEVADYRQLDEAESLLLRAARENENAETLHALGKFYLAKREFEKAIDQFEKALTHNPNDVQTHSDFGAALVEMIKNSGDQMRDRPEAVDKAFSHINRALELDGNLLEALFNRALLYQLQNLYGPAREAWKKYLEKDRNSKWADEANSYLKELEQRSSNSGGQRYEVLYRDFLQASKSGDGDKAWQLYNDSYHRYGNYITGKLIDEFLALSKQGREQEAEERLRTVEYVGRLSQQKSEDLFISELASAYRQATKEQREMLAQGRSLRQSGYNLSSKSQHQNAIVAYLKAKTLFTQAHAPPEVVTVEYWIAEAQMRQSNYNKSLPAFLSVSATCERQRYRWLRALTFNRIAAILGDKFSYSEALKYCIEAADEFSRIGDKSGQLRSFINQASFYRDMAKHRDALNLCQSSLVLANEVAAADDSWTIVLYAIASSSYYKHGLYSAALEFQKEALRIAEKINVPQSISRYNVYAGLIYSRLKDYDTAVSSIERGLNIGLQREHSSDGQDMVNFARLCLGQVYREAGRPAEAMKVLEQAAEFYRMSGWERQSYLVAKEILLVQIAMGDISSAHRQLGLVLEFLEEHRKKILQQSNRNSFFDMEQPVYDIAISFAYETLGQHEQAFDYSELSRARSLLDSATLTRQIVNDLDIPEEVLSGSTRPMTLAEIRLHIPLETQILQYAVLKDRIVAWVVTRERVESRTIALEAEELSTRVKAYVDEVSKPATEVDQRLRKMSSQLYENLIAPVENLLDKKRKLCIVPDKILNFLPYSSLISPGTGKYLIEDYSLLFAPSSTLFIRSTKNAERKARTKAERLLGIGNPGFDRRLFELPDLSSAGVETQKISDIYGGGTSLIGKQATKESLLREIERANVVHLATHYVPDERSPMLSRLILARGANSKGEADSTLTLHEVYRLKLSKARLVVLSACQTNAEQYYDGEGAIGLSHAFESVGVPLVVSSLWQVNSDTTAKLMVRFHSLRKTPGASTVIALREAQIVMLRSVDKRQHPYYWAAFIVGGGYSRF